jgi:hypothetical protein
MVILKKKNLFIKNKMKVLSMKSLRDKFLTVKLRFLEIQKKMEISKWIAIHPERVAKIDNIEDVIDTDKFKSILFKIECTKRLLDKTGQN